MLTLLTHTVVSPGQVLEREYPAKEGTSVDMIRIFARKKLLTDIDGYTILRDGEIVEQHGMPKLTNV